MDLDPRNNRRTALARKVYPGFQSLIFDQYQSAFK